MALALPVLTITFTAPAVPPQEGYVIKYRKVGTTTYFTHLATTTTVNITDGIEAGEDYEGYIQSACSYSRFSSNANFTAEGVDTVTYTNSERSGVATRNNCLYNSTPGDATYIVAAATYSSTISQADADQLAQNDVDANKQAYANANGACTPVPSQMAYSHTKSQSPHVDIILVPSYNGVNQGNIYATSSSTLPTAYSGDVVTFGLARSPLTVAWPGENSRGELTVVRYLKTDGTPETIYASGPLYSDVEHITSFTFTVDGAYNYGVQTVSTGVVTGYYPVIIEQINNSSVPLATGQPVPVNFLITDNTNGEMVWNDGTYQQNQINGFNYFSTGAADATLTITNNSSVALRFLIQNNDATTTWWDIVVPANSSTVLSTLPKQTVKITYTNA